MIDLIDGGEGVFEFLMVPYNAMNFGQREGGVKYARKHGLGIAAMNPLHGGIIAQYSDDLKIFKPENGSGVRQGMKFLLESPDIDVVLSGMNTVEQVEENCGYADEYKPVGAGEHDKVVSELKASYESMCTSCGYCVETCPQEIYIPAFMDSYNHYVLTESEEGTFDRLKWHSNFGLLKGKEPKAADCIACGNCEERCTQYLNIIERLEWLSENIEPKMKA